jgi:peroxiredoxin
MNKMPQRVPEVTFKTRVRDESIGGDNPFRWQDVTTEDLFAHKRVVLFSLPGAFTPTCSTYQLPGFEDNASEFYGLGIDEIYCISVNDSFVMNKWAQQVVEGGLKNVKVIPDGSGEFTLNMDMLVKKDNLGFGFRSWRYAVVVDNGEIIKSFVEPGFSDNHEEDPYGESSPENVLKYLQES